MQQKPNVIFITADSLRADHLGCYGYARETSPNLDHFAQDALRFTRAFSDGPNTPHAFPAIMAARSALASRRLGLFDAPHTLAEQLQTAGYHTIAFNAANPYVSGMFRYDRGFDHFRDFLNLPSTMTAGNPRSGSGKRLKTSDESGSAFITIPKLDLRNYVLSEENSRGKASLEGAINEEIFASLPADSSEPFFLWIHYMDTHYPYLPQREPQLQLGLAPIEKEENLSLNHMVRESAVASPQALGKIVDLYDAAIRQLDNKVGQVIDFLVHKELYEASLIVFAADHGEEFLEHGDLQHKSKLYDELLHVPLLVKRPGAQAGVKRDHLVSLKQLPPTILDCAGVENPFKTRSLLVDKNGLNGGTSILFAAASYGRNGHAPVEQGLFNSDPLPRRYSCRTAHWKYIKGGKSAQGRLFNLLTDSGEQTNVADQFPAKAKAFGEILESRSGALERARLRMRVSDVRSVIAMRIRGDQYGLDQNG